MEADTTYSEPRFTIPPNTDYDTTYLEPRFIIPPNTDATSHHNPIPPLPSSANSPLFGVLTRSPSPTISNHSLIPPLPSSANSPLFDILTRSPSPTISNHSPIPPVPSSANSSPFHVLTRSLSHSSLDDFSFSETLTGQKYPSFDSLDITPLSTPSPPPEISFTSTRQTASDNLTVPDTSPKKILTTSYSQSVSNSLPSKSNRTTGRLSLAATARTSRAKLSPVTSSSPRKLRPAKKVNYKTLAGLR